MWGVVFTHYKRQDKRISIFVDLFPGFGSVDFVKQFRRDHRDVADPIRLAACTSHWQHVHIIDAVNRLHAVAQAPFLKSPRSVVYDRISAGRNAYVYDADEYPYSYLHGRSFLIDPLTLDKVVELANDGDDDWQYAQLRDFAQTMLQFVVSALEASGADGGSMFLEWVKTFYSDTRADFVQKLNVGRPEVGPLKNFLQVA